MNKQINKKTVEKKQSVPFVLMTYIELSTKQKCSVLTWKYNEDPSSFPIAVNNVYTLMS